MEFGLNYATHQWILSTVFSSRKLLQAFGTILNIVRESSFIYPIL